MKRWAKRLFAAIAAWAILSPVYAVPAVERALESVVALDIRTPAGGQQCSGFVYAPGKILTAAHCTDKAVFFIVRFFDGTAARATLRAQSLVDDIAVLEFVGGSARPLAVSTRALRPGDAVIAIGHPLDYEWTVTGGIVSRILPPGRWYGFGSEADVIQHDAAIVRGSSGGPLLNAEGHVVGINVGGDARWQAVSFAVTIAHAMKVAAGFGK